MKTGKIVMINIGPRRAEKQCAMFKVKGGICAMHFFFNNLVEARPLRDVEYYPFCHWPGMTRDHLSTPNLLPLSSTNAPRSPSLFLITLRDLYKVINYTEQRPGLALPQLG